MTLRSLFSAGMLVTIGMLVGRLVGLAREMLLAGTFGVGHEADMAILLLIIPDYITLTLIGGGASATLIPAFGKASREEALAIFWQSLLLSVGIFVVVALVVFYTAGHIADAIGHGWMLLLFLLTLPMTAANSILTAWLQFRGRYTVPAFANAIFNVVIILALWLAKASVATLAGYVFLAVLIRLMFHAAAFYRVDDILPRPIVMLKTGWKLDKLLLKSYLTTATSNIFSMFPQYAPYIALAITGSGIAIFNYAFKLISTPAMLAQTTIQMVLLPWLVQRRGAGTSNDNVNAITLQCTWVLSLSLCLSLTLASHDITALCFQYGRMTGEDVDAVAQVFAIGVWALPGMLLATVWQQILYAHEAPRGPLVANALLAVLVLPACLVGKALAGLPGMALMFAAIQLVPVWWLVRAAHSLKLSSHRPARAYLTTALAIVIAWLPLALLFRGLSLSPLGGLLASIVVGGVLLASGLAACRPPKLWVRKKTM